MKDILGNLEKFGLSEKEAKTYLACLELGDSTANEIALKSNLPRTLTYDVLERLIDVGLITYSIKDHKKYFNAADPKELLRIIKEKEHAINAILPNLEILRKTEGTARPKVEIYEGIDGMKTMMNNILKSDIKEFLGYGSSRSSYEIMPAFMEEWHAERIKKKIKMRAIYNNTKQTREKLKLRKTSLKYTEYKLMPITLESPTATVIYANKVVLQNWTKDPFAVVITSKDMTNNQKKYFEELWKNAKNPQV